jgi:hypothetical protein
MFTMKPSKRTATSNRTAPSPQPPEGLADFQRAIAAAIMRPLTADDRMQPAGEDAAALVKPNDRLTAFERLEIYNRQYWFRLLDCLYEDYPGLRAVLGDARFHKLAVAYLERHPSRSPLLRNLGDRLVDFLGREPEWAYPHGAVARDMARLEWAQVVAFDGAGRSSASLAKLAGISPERIFLRLQPYASLLDLGHPVDEVVLRLLKQDSKLRSGASNAVEAVERPRRRSIASRIPRRATWLLVHRQENSVYFKRLTRAQFAVLRALADGASLADACAKIPAKNAGEVQAWFQNWAALGLLVP